MHLRPHWSSPLWDPRGDSAQSTGLGSPTNPGQTSEGWGSRKGLRWLDGVPSKFTPFLEPQNETPFGSGVLADVVS